GTVASYLSLHPGVDRFLLVKDIVSALVYLHTEGVVHGDLRGANILVDAAGRACVASFGFSCLPSPTSQIQQGPGESIISSDTVAWRAPELLEAAIANASARPTMASDIYSFGCLIYEMFTGKHPFWDVAKRSNAAFRARKIMRAVLENGSRPSKPRAHEDAFRANGMTEEVWAAMENCWAHDAGARPAASDLASGRFLVGIISDNRPTSAAY
ncbi:kinase-like protein, partial [Coprinellus micaceus]